MPTIPRNISVFALTKPQIEFLTAERMYARIDHRGHWGCSSITGFLAPGQALMEAARKDQKTLRERRVSYETIAGRLVDITTAALLRLEKSSTKPVLVENGRFEVQVHGPYPTPQFCPFSPEDDSDASPLKKWNNDCPSSRFNYVIKNVLNKKEIEMGGLLPHLIGVHHFFLGEVPYRLDPVKTLEVLELHPEADPTAPTCVKESQFLQANERMKAWNFVGGHPLSTVTMEEIAELPGSNVEKMKEGVFRINLPYMIPGINYPRGDATYTHFYNTNSENIAINEIVDGKLLQILVPPQTVAVFMQE